MGRIAGRAFRFALRRVLSDPLALLWLAWFGGAAGIYALLAYGHP